MTTIKKMISATAVVKKAGLWFVKLIPVFCFCILANTTAHADSGFHGIVSVRNDNQKIVGANITFQREDGQVTRSTVSGQGGGFKISLPVGRYWVTAKHPGYKTYSSRPGLYIVAGPNFYVGNIFMEISGQGQTAGWNNLVYSARFSDWPRVSNAHGFVGPSGSNYIMRANSNTWMGPGRYLPINALRGDFLLEVEFSIVHRTDCGLSISLSDAGSNYSQLAFYFSVWQSSQPTFSIYKNRVTNDFHVNTSARVAEREKIPAHYTPGNWNSTNRLTFIRKGNRMQFLCNGNVLKDFQVTPFDVRQLGLGISFNSEVHIASVKAIIP